MNIMPEIPKVPTIKPVIIWSGTPETIPKGWEQIPALPAPKPKSEGWGTVVNAATYSASKKWHYFRDHRSLCGKWMRFSDADLEQGNDNSVDNCAECKRRRLKELEKARKNE